MLAIQGGPLNRLENGADRNLVKGNVKEMPSPAPWEEQLQAPEQAEGQLPGLSPAQGHKND